MKKIAKDMFATEQRLIEVWYCWIVRNKLAMLVELLPIENMPSQLLTDIRTAHIHGIHDISFVSCRGIPSVRIERIFAGNWSIYGLNLRTEVLIHAAALYEEFGRTVALIHAKNVTDLRKMTY